MMRLELCLALNSYLPVINSSLSPFSFVPSTFLRGMFFYRFLRGAIHYGSSGGCSPIA